VQTAFDLVHIAMQSCFEIVFSVRQTAAVIRGAVYWSRASSCCRVLLCCHDISPCL